MSRLNNKVLKINGKDNVLVALEDLNRGDFIHHSGNEILLLEDIPAKHKIFIFDMQAGALVTMYGATVGKLTKNIVSGIRMTTDNTVHEAEAFAYRNVSYHWENPTFRNSRI